MIRRIASSLVLVAVLCFFATTSCIAQPVNGGLNSDGRDFYLGLLYPSYNRTNAYSPYGNVLGFYGVYALISSYSDNVVTVSYFDLATGTEGNKQNYNVLARRAIQVPLNVAQMKMDSNGERIEWRSCHIIGKKPINVQFFSTGSCSGGSYLALPTNVLGKEYVVEAYHDNVGGVGGNLSNEDASGYFMVIAPFDGTQVQITAASTTMGNHKGVNCGVGASGSPAPWVINLSRGQCYMVKSAANDPNCDISGSTIISTKPVAVIAGHENAFTDGSDPSPGGTRGLEARDYMIEQMFPVEFWDTTGYVSIPFVESQPPVTAGQGDEYKLFTGVSPDWTTTGPLGSAFQLSVGGFGSYNISSGPYAEPVPAYFGVTNPVWAQSNNGTKMFLVQYDQREQGGGPPYPAPSQMSIVPLSKWKNSYLWYVPSNTFENLQGYYINLICYAKDFNTQKIKLAYNGGKPAAIQVSGLGQRGKFINLPGNDSLMGVQYVLSPGAYYATCDSDSHPFMIYNYGFRAIDPNRDLGDFCGDDHFFGYALPVGFAPKGDSGQLTITVDTLCAKWHICVHDHRKTNPGVKTIEIMDDANGDIIRPPQVYHNVQFDPANPDVNPDNLLEIDLSGADTAYCFDVLVSNPLDTAGAYGPIYIIDNIGNGYLVKLHYTSGKLRFLVQPAFPNGFDSIIYPRTLPGGQVCATVKYYNYGKPTDQPVQVNGVALKKNNGYFTITNVTPKLGTSLKPGDTLTVTVCFNSKDTALHVDSLVLATGCFNSPITLVGPGGTPIIYATDHDFGTHVLGETVCDTVTVRNIGNMPLTLTKETLLDLTNFSYDAAKNPPLPLVIPPGGKVEMTFCFTPVTLGLDSTTCDWGNDISGPFADSIKPWSFLRGRGIKPGVVWDRAFQWDTTVCDSAVTRRVYLHNKSNAPTSVFNIYFDGPDNDEYSLGANQDNYHPLADTNNILIMQPQDSIWVEYLFTPKLTKTPKFRNREANLVCLFYSDAGHTVVDSTVINDTGVILYPALKVLPDTTFFGVMGPNQLVTQNITLYDTGTFIYVLSKADFTYPVQSMIIQPGNQQLQPGDTIHPGDIISVQIGFQKSTTGDTLVSLNFANRWDCSNAPIAYVEGDPENTELQAFGWNAPDTYINCRNSEDSISITNTASSVWRLDSVKIVSSDPIAYSQFDLINSSGQLVKEVYPNKAVKKGDRIYIPSKFHPTSLATTKDSVVFYLDSLDSQGKPTSKDTTLVNFLNGTGIAVQTALSAANADPNAPVPGWYVAKAADALSVPLRFTTTALVATADAKRVVFNVTYRQDLFQLNAKPNDFTPSNGYTGVITNTTDNGGFETVTIDVTNTAGPITNLDVVGNLNFTVMVAKDTTSQFVISNVTYYDEAGNSICYIATDTIPGQYISQDLCGDPSLRGYLNGQLPTRIVSLYPNPVDNNVSPILTYDVYQDNLPVKVEIYNILGEKVRTVKSQTVTAKGTYKLPVGTLELGSGAYTVRLSTPRSTQSAQFILKQ
ncbi:MAG TPA: T9SS type A sorting domain-containing protein [Candidatus Kapabacteria bacterium]|nr:T9SS type A sorting domain-containing protein [Candidatus Kapabacteria bacterium]